MDLKYMFNNEPLCPHCDTKFDIEENELYELYSEEREDNPINCPSCENDFYVTTNVKHSFSTSKEQERY